MFYLEPLKKVNECARGGNRTHMTLRSTNFKSVASTNFATRAWVAIISCRLRITLRRTEGGHGENRTRA